MSDLMKPGENMERQTPIEIALQIDAEGNTTSKALYEFLELNSAVYARWVKTNIEDNPYADEGSEYWVYNNNVENPQGGRPSINYKLRSDFAKKLAMSSGSKKGEEARDYFISVEQNAKTFANNTNNLVSLIANDPILAIRVQQIEMQQEVQEVKTGVNKALGEASCARQEARAISEILGPKSETRAEWRKRMNRILNAIGESVGNYEWPRAESYRRLEAEGYDLDRRLKNQRQRMTENGATQSKIGSLNKLDIISEDRTLTSLYASIVEKMAIEHNILRRDLESKIYAQTELEL